MSRQVPMTVPHPAHALAVLVQLVSFACLVTAQRAVTSPAPAAPIKFTTTAVCMRLQTGADRLICESYFNTTYTGSAKLYTSQRWSRLYPASYACSGLNRTCTNKDARTPSLLGSYCQPLPEGARCGSRSINTCNSGVCTGSQTLSSGPALPIKAAPTAPLIGGKTPIAISTAADNAITVRINTAASGYGSIIPQGFLGTSHEWGRLADYCNNETISGAWMNIFKNMGPRAVLRVGGFSTEALTDVPDAAQFSCLRKISEQTGATWIIGVNVYRHNMTLTRAMANAAQAALGSYLQGVEMGNEPKYWPDNTPLGGWDSNNNVIPGAEAWANLYDSMARQLTDCPRQSGAYARTIYGPAWDNINTISDAFLQSIVKLDPYYSTRRRDRCYTREITLHYYPYLKPEAMTRKVLLSEDLMRYAADTVKARQAALDALRLPGLRLRLGEVGSLSGGGKQGVSDVLAGALWTADYLFEMAVAGVTGVNLHWGLGGIPNAAGNSAGGPAYVGVQTNFKNFQNYPSVHPPWFGYLFFQRVVAPQRTGVRDTSVTDSQNDVARLVNVVSARASGACSDGTIKVWPVQHLLPGRPSELRVGILHKGDAQEGSVPCTVKIEANQYFGTGRIMRLEGWTPSLGLADKLISLGRQNYTNASGLIGPWRPTDPAGPVYDTAGLTQASTRCISGGANQACTTFTVQMLPGSGVILAANKCSGNRAC